MTLVLLTRGHKSYEVKQAGLADGRNKIGR